MNDYVWSSMVVIIVGFMSAASGLFSVQLFSEKWRIWIYLVSGASPVVSMFLVGLKVADAGPYNIFIDPIVCIAWVALVNILFAVVPRLGWPVQFHIWLLAVLFGIVIIRFFISNFWS